jgi:hypothetical protein
MRAIRRDITPTLPPKTGLIVFAKRQHAPIALAFQVQS